MTYIVFFLYFLIACLPVPVLVPILGTLELLVAPYSAGA